MIDTLYTDEGLKERLNGYMSRSSYTIKGIKEILLVTAIIRLRDINLYDEWDPNMLYNNITKIIENNKCDIEGMVNEFSSMLKEFCDECYLRKSVKEKYNEQIYD